MEHTNFEEVDGKHLNTFEGNTLGSERYRGRKGH